jgi:site-specific DNA recombinase
MKNENIIPVDLVQQMAKKSKAQKWRNGNIVVNYTRVSDASQFDNTSLETQKKDAIAYAQKRNLVIKEHFGGVVESAKTDERKEFNRLLDFVKKDKSITAILVYSYERFSRSEHAMSLTNELKKIGIKVMSVIQEVDVTSAAGRLQQNIFYAFGNYDNELRKEKTVRGMVENLLNGYWVGACPFGYTNLKRKEKAKYHEYVINEDGKILKLGFKWKAEGKLSNLEIVQKMRKMGCSIQYKSFVRIISNPFYCGFITHSLIPDETIKGHHPVLVSLELFQKANGILNQNPHKGISKKFKIEELPLKGFAKDESTLSPFTGYTQKNQWYYKTRDKGTKINQNAKLVHQAFLNELVKLEPVIKDEQKLENLVLNFVKEKMADHFEEQHGKAKTITALKSKIVSLEERYVDGVLEMELYHKYRQKFEQEIRELEQEMSKSHLSSSNLEMAVKKGISISQNISQLWLASDYSDKQRLQYLIYPDGILYNKQTNTVRTPRINSVFSAIACLASVSGKNKNGQSKKIDQNSHWVVPTGIEPVSKV